MIAAQALGLEVLQDHAVTLLHHVAEPRALEELQRQSDVMINAVRRLMEAGVLGLVASVVATLTRVQGQ